MTFSNPVRNTLFFWLFLICFVPSAVEAQPKRKIGQFDSKWDVRRREDACSDLFGESCATACTVCATGYNLNDDGQGCSACTCNQFHGAENRLDCNNCSGCNFDEGENLCYLCSDDYGDGCKFCNRRRGCTSCPDEMYGEDWGVDKDGKCTSCDVYGVSTKQLSSKGGSFYYKCDGVGFFNPDAERKRCCERCIDITQKNKCDKNPEDGRKKCNWVSGNCVPKDDCSYTTRADCKAADQCKWRGNNGPSSSRQCYELCKYADPKLPNVDNCKNQKVCVDGYDGASCERCKPGYDLCFDTPDTSAITGARGDGYCVLAGTNCILGV